MRLIGPDNLPIDVPDEHVPDAFLKEGYGLPAGARVPMVAANGQVGHVPAEKAQEAFASGARVATPEEIHKADIHAQYDNLAGYLKAGAAEFGNQALLGAGDALAVGAAHAFGSQGDADKVRQTLSDLREENPGSSIAGGVAGAVAPMLASGGASAAVEGAEGAGVVGKVAGLLSAPTEALGAAGGAAAKLAERIAPEAGDSFASRLLHTAVVDGARNAAEGAIVNAGNELTEESLGDPELSGEKLLAALGHGALLGGAAGGLLAGTGEIGREVLGRMRPGMQRAAGEQAFRALNPERRFVKLADKIEGGAAGVGRELLDQGVIEAGDKLTDIAPKVAAARAKAGEKLGSMLGELDALGPEYAPDPSKVIDRVRREVIEPLSKVPGYKSEVSAVADYLEDFAAKTQEGLSFTGLRDIRAALDDKIYRGSSAVNPSPIMKELQKMRGIVEDELARTGDEAAASIGKTFREGYDEAKLSYRRLAVADQAAQNATAAMTANRIISPSDYIMTAAGLAGHGLVGGLQGVAMGAVHHVIRERGNSASAVLLDKLSTLGAIQRATRVVDGEIDRGIAGVLEPGKRAEVGVREGAFAKDKDPYRAHADAVIGAATRPDAHASDVAAAVAPLAMHAPKVTNAFQRAAIRTTAALAAAVPKRHLPPPSITPQFDKPYVPDDEQARYDRERAIAHDPIGVTFSELAKNQLTKEHVDAFASHAPKLYGDVVARTQRQLAALKHPLPTATEQQVRVLMGMPPADPDLLRTLQQSFATASAPSAVTGGGQQGHATPHQRQGLANAQRLSGLNTEQGD